MGDHKVEERVLKPANGMMMLLVTILGLILSVAVFIGGIACMEHPVAGVIVILLAVALFVMCCIMFNGFRILEPNEAIVLTLFGKYYGTVKTEGFYFINPFCGTVSPKTKQTGGKLELTEKGVSAEVSSGSRKVSLKTMTLNNEKQKVNDILGNPIIIGAVVIWQVEDPTKAVFNVENYRNFLSIQCDSTIRNVARMYPYDAPEEDVDEKSLRGSSQEVAEQMQKELQKRVDDAGLRILEVRITHLSYAEEIAAAMLQRQQAVAVIAARKKIVEGAVGMVNMAIDQLSEQGVVELDEERKAQMVSNLMVVLCGNKDAQPIVNSGSIY